MLKGKFQERTVELKWAQEPSVTLQFWFRSEMAQTSEQCYTSQDFAQSQQNFALSHDGETVTFRNSGETGTYA